MQRLTARWKREAIGRGERIRTSGLYVPNVALYQAKLHPDSCTARPVDTAMRRGTETQRALVRRAVEEGALDQLDQVIAIVRDTGALDVAHEAAAAEAKRAMSAAEQLPPDPHAQALVQLAASLLQRRN